MRPQEQDSTRFEPSEVEPRLVSAWLGSGLTTPGEEGGASERFSLALPPPNVTGTLHMGHALNGTIQDCLARHYRLRDRRVKWIYGTDHAGIATQTQVERRVVEEGTTRRALGRDAFVERVWRWREDYGGRIAEQLKRLGATCDFADERFTLDPGYAAAVQKVFVDLHAKGAIYRDEYIVNWDPGSQSAISDLEVEEREVLDTLYHVAYPLADGSGEVVVATVRPETMLADVAIAVNPGDERHRHLVGREAVLPLVGRRLPIVADEYVKPEFGTGCLKITPAHDRNDFEIGRRHGLGEPRAIDERGRMTDLVARFAGLTSLEAREAVVSDLRAQGLLRAEEPYVHAVPFSHRSGERIEPLISLQWFMRMEELAVPAIDALRDGRVRIHPASQARRCVEWTRGDPPVVHLASAVVGPPDPGLVPRRGDVCRRRRSRGRRVGAGSRRARHVVLVRAVAVRGARLAHAHARAARLLSHRRARHGARHPVPVGRPHDHARARAGRRRAVPRGVRALGDPGA